MLQTMVDHHTRCWMPDIRINVCSTYNTESSCVEVVSMCGYYLYRGGYPATTNTPKLTLYESSPVPPSISGNRSQASLSTIGSSLSISGWNPISAQGSSFCNGMNECEAIFCSTCLASWSLFYFLLHHVHFFIFYCNIFTPASFMRTPCLIIEFTFEAAIPHTLNFSLIEKNIGNDHRKPLQSLHF